MSRSSDAEPVRVVISGIGPIVAGARDRAAFWAHLRDGRSQLSLEPDPHDPALHRAIGRIHDFDVDQELSEVPARFRAQYPRELVLYLASLYRAREDGCLDSTRVNPARMGLYDGAARSTFAFWWERFQELASTQEKPKYTRRDLMTGLAGQTVGVAASLLGVRGPTYCFSGTCSSGAMAIGHAYREIALGEIDVAFATGHDSALVPPLFGMYGDANLLSVERETASKAIRAYVGHSTNAFAEGAVTLLLESAPHALQRGVVPIAEICGYGYGNNAYHPTAVDVSGVRPAEVIETLLQRTGIARDDVDFVVGHGNGVQLSDVSEHNYMRLIFERRAAALPLLSTKPVFGHTLGASSAVNAAAAALVLHHQYVFPTINIDESKQKRAVFHQPNVGEARACHVGLTVAYGMGGHNTVLALRRWSG